MKDIIARLEAAEQGSRELDARIENVIVGGSAKDLEYILTDIETTTRPPHYTTSIDAALTLVPKRDIWDVGIPQKYQNIPSPIPYAGRPCIASVDIEHVAWAATPALALCIAALKARDA